MSPYPFVGAVILAAGFSSRLGRNKLLLPLGEKRVLEWAVDSALSSRASQVVVVLGHEEEKLKRLLRARPVTFASNPCYREGQAGSLLAGVRALDERAEAALFCLGDQPLAGAALMNLLMDAYAEARGRCLLVAPLFQGMRRNPVLISLELRQELLELRGDLGARHIIEKIKDQEPERFLTVPWEEPEAFLDIDKEKDYRRVLEALKERPKEG